MAALAMAFVAPTAVPFSRYKKSLAKTMQVIDAEVLSVLASEDAPGSGPPGRWVQRLYY